MLDGQQHENYAHWPISISKPTRIDPSACFEYVLVLLSDMRWINERYDTSDSCCMTSRCSVISTNMLYNAEEYFVALVTVSFLLSIHTGTIAKGILVSALLKFASAVTWPGDTSQTRHGAEPVPKTNFTLSAPESGYHHFNGNRDVLRCCILLTSRLWEASGCPRALFISHHNSSPYKRFPLRRIKGIVARIWLFSWNPKVHYVFTDDTDFSKAYS
jgi:hypothetical protein